MTPINYNWNTLILLAILTSCYEHVYHSSYVRWYNAAAACVRANVTFSHVQVNMTHVNGHIMVHLIIFVHLIFFKFIALAFHYH